MRPLTVGVISDTHGLLRPQAVEYLRDSDLIVHAGDIGKPDVITALSELAPVHAIRGNVDRGEWASAFPDVDRITIDGHAIYLIHDVNSLEIDPHAERIRVVISGHSHMPRAEERDGVLFFNPGSAGPRRFRLPISLGRLWFGDDDVRYALEEITA